MKKIVALLTAVMMLFCVAAVAEEAGFEETPIYVDGTEESGNEQDVEAAHLHVAAVYFQPVPMEPADIAGLGVEGANFHIEADISALENGYGFGAGDWVPYLTIDFKITSETTGKVAAEGTMMPMSASDGPHYGLNVALTEADTYTLTFIIHSPAENGYLLHVDEETGVTEHSFWSEPVEVNFQHWEYTVQEW